MNIISILFLVLILGLIPAMIAYKKGKNFIGWYIYGILFFLIALVHALLISEDTEKFENQQLKEGVMKKCPYCAELVKKEASVCRHCGKSLLFNITEKQVKSEAKKENKVDDAVLINQLEQLNSLKEKGVLTIEEYDLKAAKIKEALFGLKKESIDVTINSQEKNIEPEKETSKMFNNANSINKPIEDNNENPNKTLYIVFSIILLLVGIGVIFYSTKGDWNINKPTEFNKTEFSDRNEELKYIRGYLQQELPIISIKIIPPEKTEKAKQQLIAAGKDFTTREVVDSIIKAANTIELVMTDVIKNNLTFTQVKDKLENFPSDFFTTTQKTPTNTNNKPAVYESHFLYTNIQTGDTVEFTDKNYPWDDTLHWKFAKALPSKSVNVNEE